MQAAANFTVADLEASGQMRATQLYELDLLQQIPGAAELIGQLSGQLWKSPEEFEVRLTPTPLVLRWRSCSTASGIGTLREDGKTISLSLLAGGSDPEVEALTFNVFQQHLVRELHDTPHEPAFDLMHIQERPLIATFTFDSPSDPASQNVAAVVDRCLAASYFRYLRLI